MKKILALIVCIMCLGDKEILALPLRQIPTNVINRIKKDYSNKAEYTAGRSSVLVQDEQIFVFETHKRHFAVLPFMFVPKDPDLARQCVVRLLASPEFKFIQDLPLQDMNTSEVPCNGVMAIGFKDVNFDKNKDILVLYDFHTRGNPDLPPYPAVFVFDPNAETFRWDQKLSEKAGRNDVRTIKGMYLNLK